MNRNVWNTGMTSMSAGRTELDGYSYRNLYFLTLNCIIMYVNGIALYVLKYDLKHF